MPKIYQCDRCKIKLGEIACTGELGGQYCSYECSTMGDFKKRLALNEPEQTPYDSKHYVSDRMLNTIKKVAYNQDDFGIKKYGKPLTASMNYDWLQMTIEELADGLKYLQNEITRKKGVLELLEIGIESRSWEYVKFAYNELNKNGTGKEHSNDSN